MDGNKVRAHLADRMEAVAQTHQRGADLWQRATALRDAEKGFFQEPQTVSVQQFLAAWACARRLWCDITGEPIL